MEQTHETQLAELYNAVGFRRVIARYDVSSTLHETGPWSIHFPLADVFKSMSLQLLWEALSHDASSVQRLFVIYAPLFIAGYSVLQLSELVRGSKRQQEDLNPEFFY